MKNSNDINDNDLVWRDNFNRDNDHKEALSDNYENSFNEFSNESNHIRFSFPKIFGAVCFLVLVVLLIFLLLRSQNYAGKEQILIMGKRLDNLESEFTALKNLISSKLDQAIIQMENHTHNMAPRKVPVAEKTPLKQNEQLDNESKVHEVQTGDSLYKISLQYGISIELLRDYNNFEPNDMIYPGQVIKLTP